MSHFPFNNLSDPDEDGYTIARVNDYPNGGIGIGSNPQMVRDHGAIRNQMAGYANDWYGTLVNAPSNLQLVQSYSGYQETTTFPHDVGPSYDTSFGPLQVVPSASSSHHNAIDRIPSPDLHPDHWQGPIIVPVSVQFAAPTPIVPASVHVHVLFPDNLEGHPSVPEDLVMRLRGAGAVSLASLAMDTTNFLWIYMSTNTLGRTPSDILCNEIYIKAIQRRQRALATWVPEEVMVVLPVMQSENDEQFAIHETPVMTHLSDALFKEALFTELREVARAFRLHAFRSANYLIHTSSTRLGIIPPLNEVTPEFKTELKIALGIGPHGPRILHGRQDSDDPMISNLFGNIIFRNLVREALYDSDSEGWFGFTEDTDGPNGPIWTPLVSPTCYTVGYVSAWLIEAANDFCDSVNIGTVTPQLRLTDAKTLKVNSLAKKIGSILSDAMIGVPGVPVAIQNAARMSLMPFTRRG